jgi:hypothetical protein
MARARARSFSITVTRYLTFVAVALVIVQPTPTLGAPPGSSPVYHPALPAHAAATSSAERSASKDRFTVPLDVDVRPKPLPGEQRPAMESWQTNPQPTLNRWREWQVSPGYLGYPPWYQSACYANNGLFAPYNSLAAPAGDPAPADMTIGSLVDGRAKNLFSMAPSYDAGLTTASNVGAATSSPVAFQYGFQTTPCGPLNFVGF